MTDQKQQVSKGYVEWLISKGLFQVNAHGTSVTDWNRIGELYEVTDFVYAPEPVRAKPDLIAHGLWPETPIRKAKRKGGKSVIEKPYNAMSPKIRYKVLKRDGYRCRTCEATDDLTIDHIIPKAKGGSSAIDNLQILCYDCNQLKADALAQG